METSPALRLPYIMPSQAQKHVSYNEAVAILDALVQLRVRSRGLAAPPGGESDGDRFIVAQDATGPWAGWEASIALRTDGGWRRIDPVAGWLAWVEDEDVFVRFAGAAWSDLNSTPTDLQDVALMGVGTVADPDNPFSAKLNKALWTARYEGEGGDGDLRYTLNKQGPADVLSLLMQTDWSGRAEIGLVGNDDLSIKVSADGSDWKEAVRFDGATGAASFPHTSMLAALGGLDGVNGAFVRFTGRGTAAMQAMVGAVSQSGGVPTGAIVETGTNANGQYVRWADGTQICSAAVTSNSPRTYVGAGTWSNPYRTNVNSWPYPAAFTVAPVVVGNVLTPGASVALARSGVFAIGGSGIGAVSLPNFQGFYFSDNSENLTPVFLIVAMGRWF